MADVCVAEIDTLIDVSPADITTAADWLDKLQLGFNHAESWLITATHQCTQISGEFGNSLNEYTNDLRRGCQDAFDQLVPIIDTINSWHDQVVWRKQDMAGYRDDAKAGGLTVREDRYIQAPESVSDPGNPPKGATEKQKNTWQTAHDEYNNYLEKSKLFDDLQEDAGETRKKLSDWVAQHMTVSSESPLYELTVKALQDGTIEFSAYGIENIFLGPTYDSLVQKATPAATKRAALKSKNPQTEKGGKSPNPDSVARRAEASAKAKGGDPAFSAKAAKVGKRVGTTLTLALSGWEIYNGNSPSKVGIETAAGFVVAAGVGAVAAAATAPAWVTAGATVLVGGAIVWGVGKAYENTVPLRTRERIDEGIRDAANWVGDKAYEGWKSVFTN
ncbi:hypothetical protein [Actinomyces naeslundii]|jgi:hypothetical protein|uniref:hypothetical protein n=1 Tax=Actinomyces naeslundii TaxID=1655 RepID=UPI000A7E060A|nr:hypothetical protein [Actinomyces naeslundii]